MRLLLAAAVILLPLPVFAQGAGAGAASQSMGTLVIVAGKDGVPVRVDGTEIGQTPLPGPWTLAAGEHRVEFLPAGAAPVVRTVSIVAGQATEVKVFDAPTAAPVEPPPDDLVQAPVDPVSGPGFSLATAGYIAAGVGLATVGAGVALGLMADGAADDAFAATSRSAQQDAVDQADAFAFGANVSYGAGGLMVLGGAAMILLASDGPLGDGVTVAPAPGGAVIGGRF